MKHTYTKEQEQFLKDNVKGISLKELTKRFNEHFNLDMKESQISNKKKNLNIKSGVNGQFQKGNKPHNKGLRWSDYMSKAGQENSRKTTFKKGNIPSNHRNLYEERFDKDGYIEIKIKEPNQWEFKHRFIYENKYGKIPKGHKIIFLDGDKYNLDIDNLKLVSNAEELIMNKNNLRYNNKDLTNTGHLIAKVLIKRNNTAKKGR